MTLVITLKCVRDSLREFMRMFSQEILIVFGYRGPKSIEEKGA